MSSDQSTSDGGDGPDGESDVAAEAGVEQVATLAAEGHEQAAATEEKVVEIGVAASEARESVADLTEAVDRIAELADLIDDVAEQTNVLALNAAIESARAGEAGDGFGVVADEVKELAAETRTQTEEIAAFVEDVESDVNQTVDSLEAVNESISEAMGLSQGSKSRFEDIRERTEAYENGADRSDAS